MTEPRKGRQARRSPADLSTGNTLKGDQRSSMRPAGQVHERFGPWRAAGGEGEPPREEEAHEGRGPLSVLNNPAEDADACRD